MKKIEFLNKESNKIVTLPLDKKMIFNQKLKNSISMISIVKEINESDSDYINKILNNNKNDHTIGKFISGGILWWLLGIIVLFFYNAFNKEDNKKGKNWGTRIAGFILCAIIGGLIGLICSIIPTIFNIWVNYIIIPILVLVLIILLLYKTSSNN